jgi:hypothetical protein
MMRGDLLVEIAKEQKELGNFELAMWLLLWNLSGIPKCRYRLYSAKRHYHCLIMSEYFTDEILDDYVHVHINKYNNGIKQLIVDDYHWTSNNLGPMWYTCYTNFLCSDKEAALCHAYLIRILAAHVDPYLVDRFWR